MNPDILGGVIKNKIGMSVLFFYKTIVICVIDGFRHINLFYHLLK